MHRNASHAATTAAHSSSYRCPEPHASFIHINALIYNRQNLGSCGLVDIDSCHGGCRAAAE